MRLRSCVVGVALGAVIAATHAAPAAANHTPGHVSTTVPGDGGPTNAGFYGWMGIIEITSLPTGNVSYAYSGFAPTDWSGGCSITTPYSAPGFTTTVSCTPPAPPAGFTANYCLTTVVSATTTAPAAAPGTVTGSSTCQGMGATAQASGGSPSASAAVPLRSLAVQFPWRCTASAPPTMQTWSVRCALSH